MSLAIAMPRLGMTMEEGTVIEWPFSIGQHVEKGDIVLIIESEKAEVEIEAADSGFFRHIYVDEGDTVPCGALLGAMTETDDESFDPDFFLATQEKSDTGAGGGLKVKSGPGTRAESEVFTPPTAARKPIVPAARAAAKKLGIDPQDVPGTGPNGRVTKQDVESYAAAREQLVQVAQGVSLEVLLDGAGDSVVLLPGLGTDSSAFVRQTPLLAERFRVYGVNPRGVGLSDAPDTDVYEVAQTAADAAAVYDGAAHVIGASLGAAAALELAIAEPSRVKTLTLITPFVEANPRLLAVAAAWQRLASETGPETLAMALLPWFFSAEFLTEDSARSRTQRGLAQTLARVPAATLERMVAGMASWSGSRKSDLARIDVPTLVIGASDDLLTQDPAAIAEAIPDAKLLMVDGAGHAVALEAPAAVNEAIGAHLT